MRGPLSIPQGILLKALGVRNSPTQIDGVQDQALVGIDFLPWLIEANQAIIDGNATLVLAGNGYASGGLGLAPPRDKIWLVRYASVSCICTAANAEVIEFHVARTSNTAPGLNVVVGPLARSSPVGAPRALDSFTTAFNDQWFFVNGRFDEQIGACVQYIDTPVAITAQVNAQYWQFDA